ncbi:MAG: PAS domain-containing protein, partial [Desulfobulbus sp.]|nr:PAS domain-containing protein [Desulfobulbus sp.]
MLEVETKDGSKRYILNYTAPLKNEQGKIKGGMIANLDISKRVAAQRKAEEAEQRIRLIFDTSPNCLFIKDKLGRYVLANHATASLFNTTEKYLIGKTDEELHGGRWEQNQAESSEHELCEERWFVAKNGVPRWFRFFTAPISLPGYAGIELTIAVDITETRQVQEELRQSEAQKGMILDSLNSQVVMLDRDLSLLWANKTAVEQKIDDQNCPVHCYETSTHVLQPCKPCAGCPTRDAL